MSYFAPQVNSAGLSVPQFTDIVNYLISQYQLIFGSTVSTDNSNYDIQLIDIIAQIAADCNSGLQLDYNNRAPNFAIGAALDSVVSFNGLARKVASASTVNLTLAGNAGAVINNGVVVDSVFGQRWDLPPTVTFGGPTVNVTATCEVLGAFNVPANSGWSIQTPTAGWTGTSNAAASAPGQPVEADSQLRTRQALSVTAPSQTQLTSTVAAIARTLGVTRYNIDENTTNATNANNTPGHSIQAVVENGANTDIANAIYFNKGIGCGTFGAVSVPITDATTAVVTNIAFQRPTYVPIFVTVNAHILPGGTTAVLAAIQTALVNYIQSLQIGELVSYGQLVAAAASVNPNPSNPIVSIRSLFFGTASNPSTITDVNMTFIQVAQGLAANVIVNNV